MKNILCVIFLSVCFTGKIYSQPDKSSLHIYFDGSAARFVLLNPEISLNQRDSVWDNYEAFRITRVWHKASDVPMTWKIWNTGLNKVIKDPALAGRSMKLLTDVIDLEKEQHEKITRHLASYLPVSKPVDAFVYFTAYTDPYAFCVEKNKIGIDISADEWYNDPECLINMIIHELYHVGFTADFTDTAYLHPVKNEEFVNFNYAYLLTEGMATYVAFKALDLFETDYKHDDYKLMEDDRNIVKAISGINSLLEMTKTEPVDTLNKKIWEIGVVNRAYYIAGSYICDVIEKNLGKDYLVKVIFESGTLQAIKVYNSLVPEDRRMQVPS